MCWRNAEVATAKKTQQTKSTTDDGGDRLARKIWLAGIGAYGKSVTDAQDQIDRAGQEASRLFNELVERGQTIEEQKRAQIDDARARLGKDARERLDEVKDKITGAKDRLKEATDGNTSSVEELICRVRERMGFDKAMVRSLDRLANQVESLAELVTGAFGINASKSRKSSPNARAKAKAKRPKAAAKTKAKAKAKSTTRVKAKAKRKT